MPLPFGKVYNYPWYTQCTSPGNISPWSVPWSLIIPSLLLVLGSPFVGYWGLLGVAVGCGLGYAAIASVFNNQLGGKLLCLGGGFDRIACGTVTKLEPPQDSLYPGNIDNDFSWNLLVCPYKLIRRDDHLGNPLLDENNNWIYDPEPYSPPEQAGPLDYLCLSSPEFTALYNQYQSDIVAPNPFAQIYPGQQDLADVYFYALNPNGASVNLPPGFSYPPEFPPPGLELKSNFPPLQGQPPLTVFGQGDSPSGTVAGVDGFEYTSTANPKNPGQIGFTTNTTGLSAQIHCEIEGSRVVDMQTASEIMMAVLTVGAVAASLTSSLQWIGGIMAFWLLFLALLIDAAIWMLTWALGSDPNVSEGTNTGTSPYFGDGSITNNLTINVGDYLVVLGRWVFDVGHCPNRASNELHPVKMVFCPTYNPNNTDLIYLTDPCLTFCEQVTEVLLGSLAPPTLEIQQLPQFNFAFHPDVDGCEPVNDPPPPIPK